MFVPQQRTNPNFHWANTIVIATCLLSHGTFAQTSTTGSISVNPGLAGVGVTREIVVSDTWPHACPPETIEVRPEPPINPERLVLRLHILQTFAICAQTLTPYVRKATYTPQRVGKLPVVAETSDGRVVALGRIDTLSKTPTTMDLSGTWIDSFGGASILMLTQSELNPDALVGSLNLFDRLGLPRWQVIHSSTRTSPNTIEAPLYEFTTTPNEQCASVACPVAGTTPRQIGIVRITTEFTHQLNITVYATSASGTVPESTVLFRSIMHRLLF